MSDNPQAKKELDDYERANARVFHCRVCKVIGGTLYKSGKGYVCFTHRNYGND